MWSGRCLSSCLFHLPRLRVFLAVGCLIVAVGCAAPRKSRDYDGFSLGRRAEPAEGARAPAAALEAELPDGDEDDLIVGSWNIKWFGRSAVEKYDFVTMADFVEECDAVALQELSDAHFAACMQALKDELSARGRDYVFTISENTGYDDNLDPARNDYLERYAFIWDAERLQLKSPPRFIAAPELNNDTFRQVPWVADFQTTGGDGFDFRLMSVHTVYNDDLNLVRRAEIQAIGDWVVSESQGDEHNVIAIGDFNANPDGQPHHFAELIPDGSRFRVLMYESGDAGETPIRTTVPTKDTSTNPTYFQLPVYDHMLISLATSSALPANPMTRAGQFMGVYAFDDDPWWKENGWTRAEIIKAVSDHRPVWFKLNYNAPDED